MKRILSVILVIVTVLGTFSVLASADDESGIEKTYRENILTADYCGSDSCLRISFNEKYKTFADNISVDMTENYGSKDNRETHSGDDIITAVEDTKIEGEVHNSPVIYISNIKAYWHYAVIPENTVFDADGNGNEEIVISEFGDTAYINSDKETDNLQTTYSMFFESDFPVDCYVNGVLAGENVYEYSVELSGDSDYTLSLRKNGLELCSETANRKDCISVGEISVSDVEDAAGTVGFLLEKPLGMLTDILRGIVMLPGGTIMLTLFNVATAVIAFNAIGGAWASEIKDFFNRF